MDILEIPTVRHDDHPPSLTMPASTLLGSPLPYCFPRTHSVTRTHSISTIHNFQRWNSHSARLAPDGVTLNTSAGMARSVPSRVTGGVRSQTPYGTEPSNEDVENASKITQGYARSHGPRSNNGKQTTTKHERQQQMPSRRPWRKPCRRCGTCRHNTNHRSPF